MAHVKNISNGPRGAYLKGVLVEAEIGQVIEADDFPEEWFEEVDAKEAKKADPLDHDGDGKKGGHVDNKKS